MNESMYERIMDLPLFKGTSHDQISRFVEKVQLLFEKYGPGDIIHSPGDECRSLILMLGGAARLTWTTSAGEFLLSHEVGKGAMIGSDMLFGMYCRYPCTIETSSDCSLMRMDKRSFLGVVKSNDIYIINLLNQLSLKIQRCREAILDCSPPSLLKVLRYLVMSLTASDAADITVTSDPSVLSAMSGLTPEDIVAQAQNLQKKGIIRNMPDGRFAIPSREVILDSL